MVFRRHLIIRSFGSACDARERAYGCMCSRSVTSSLRRRRRSRVRARSSGRSSGGLARVDLANSTANRAGAARWLRRAEQRACIQIFPLRGEPQHRTASVAFVVTAHDSSRDTTGLCTARLTAAHFVHRRAFSDLDGGRIQIVRQHRQDAPFRNREAEFTARRRFAMLTLTMFVCSAARSR